MYYQWLYHAVKNNLWFKHRITQQAFGAISFVMTNVTLMTKMVHTGTDRAAKLIALGQATYVLEQVTQGKLPPQIVDAFDGNSPLVEIWTSFLTDIRWIERDKTCLKGYIVTEKGNTWLAKLAAQKSPLLLSL
jgi:uncharacterized radical SAM superfamily Fe-S cluster-containing enzyme